MVARHVEDTASDDSVIVLVHDDQQRISRADWLRLLRADGPTDVDAQASPPVRRPRCHLPGFAFMFLKTSLLSPLCSPVEPNRRIGSLPFPVPTIGSA